MLTRYIRYLHILIVMPLIVVVSACNGGTSGNDLTIAIVDSGQNIDPVVQDFPLIYVSRPLVEGGVMRSARQLNIFDPGAQLVIKDRAIPSAIERVLAGSLPVNEANALDLYDIRDIEPDYAGRRLLFSMRGPFIPDADLEDQPSWNIWLYDLETDALRRVISSDTVAESGQDRDPVFLPDGRIVFTSDRQRQSRAILLDEGRPQFSAQDEDGRENASVLHVMNDDGTDIEQITFNQSHDQKPTVTRNGRIVFSRWDNSPGNDVMSLYSVDPDGRRLERLYGYHSETSGRDGSTITFHDLRELDDGRLIALARDKEDPTIGGDILFLDVENFVEVDQPTFLNDGLQQPGQESPLEDIVQLAMPSMRGRFAAAYPFYDGTNRLLISWSQCRLIATANDLVAMEGSIVPCTQERLQDPDVQSAEPLYGLWILNLDEDSQQPVVTPEEGVFIAEAVILSPRVVPFFVQPEMADDETQSLIDASAGAIHILSTYGVDGVDTALPNLDIVANPSLTNAANRPVHFLRLLKPVSMPDDEIVDLPGTAFGRSRAQSMREILGYARVHPDGSVFTRVPANVPFTISLLDSQGRRISQRHNNWLQVRPGEVLRCHGCHLVDSRVSHGRRDADPLSVNPGAPFSGLNPAFSIATGETMAQGFARSSSIPDPNLNIIFEDVWTDTAQATPDASYEFDYQSLSSPAPVSASCLGSWQASCRITIHYEDHIHPLWSVNRDIVDVDGVTVLQTKTCTRCHNIVDELGVVRVPAAQLDLTDGPSTDQPDHFKSYRELLFNDSEQEINGGILVDILEPVFDANGNQVFEVDELGEVILDANGDPIPVVRPINVSPSMRTNGALASSQFFQRFEPGASHADYLTGSELRLLIEWLDIGAQYYNDPFRVPQ